MTNIYWTRDSEAGNLIEGFDTLEEAEDAIIQYEQEDEAEGCYEDGFYEVVCSTDLQ